MTLTVDDFWLITQKPENDNKRLELLDGKMIERALARPMYSVIGVLLVSAIVGFNEQTKSGYVVAASAGFALGDRTMLMPTGGYISKARIPVLPDDFFRDAP